MTVCGFLRTVELFFKPLFSNKLCPVILKTTHENYGGIFYVIEYFCLQ